MAGGRRRRDTVSDRGRRAVRRASTVVAALIILSGCASAGGGGSTNSGAAVAPAAAAPVDPGPASAPSTSTSAASTFSGFDDGSSGLTIGPEVWTGRDLLAVAGGCERADVVVLDGRTWTWSKRPVPDGVFNCMQGQAVWTGKVMVYVGRTAQPTVPIGVWTYDPSDDRWQRLAGTVPPRFDLGRPVWTGSEVLLWLGEVPDGGPPATADAVAIDPARGTVTRLPRAPLRPRIGVWEAFTGKEWIVWGGGSPSDSSYADGAAFDVRTRRWRTLPAAPIRDRAWHLGLWTGTELVVWGGRAQCCPRPNPACTASTIAARPRRGIPRSETCEPVLRDSVELADGAAYDPARDRWRRIAVDPRGPRLHPLLEAPEPVWTGREVLILGGAPAGSGWPAGAETGGAAYDPVADTWRTIPPQQRRGILVGGVWTGEEAVFVERGGRGFRLGG